MKQRKGWRMSCDVGKAREGLENELWRRWVTKNSFSNISVTSPTSQLILQPFRRFTYVTAHSPTLPLLHLRHNSFSNPYFASPTSQALHLIHLASRLWWAYISTDISFSLLLSCKMSLCFNIFNSFFKQICSLTYCQLSQSVHGLLQNKLFRTDKIAGIHGSQDFSVVGILLP